VVIAEFVLLTGVYERAIPVSRAEVVVAAVDGQLQSAGSAPATTLARQALAAADRAHRAGGSRAAVEAVERAGRAVLAAPGQPGQAEALRQAVHALGRDLARRHTTLDLQAKALYALIRNASDVVAVCDADSTVRNGIRS